MAEVLAMFEGNLKVPDNFQQSMPAYDPERDGDDFANINEEVTIELNPQTIEFCAKLQVNDPLFLAAKMIRVHLDLNQRN